MRRRILNPSLVLQGENVFFVITNLIVTPNQRQETCAEVRLGAELGRGVGEPPTVAGVYSSLEAGVSVSSKGPGACVHWCMYLHFLVGVGGAGSQRVCGPRMKRNAYSNSWGGI